MNYKFSNVSPRGPKGRARGGNLGEATLETRGEILGWTDTGGKWMWAHGLTQTLGLCPQGKLPDHQTLVKLSSLTHTTVGANGLLTQVQPKSRSVGLPSEANSHLPESELRGARRPFPRGKIEKLINLKKVRQKMGSDSDDQRDFEFFCLDNQWQSSGCILRRQCLTIMSLWLLEYMLLCRLIGFTCVNSSSEQFPFLCDLYKEQDPHTKIFFKIFVILAVEELGSRVNVTVTLCGWLRALHRSIYGPL